MVVCAEIEMSDHEREIYRSENGDRWLLCRDDDERDFVLHKANVASGGAVTKIELGDFLGRDKAGPEHQALARLIRSLCHLVCSGGCPCDPGGGEMTSHAIPT